MAEVTDPGSLNLTGQETLTELAVRILETGDAEEKVRLTDYVCKAWKEGKIEEVGNTLPPDTPAPPKGVTLVAPWEVPKRGKASAGVAMLHALAHIEFMAINLAWDILARFAVGYDLPREYLDEWVRVAEEEAKHHRLLAGRLVEVGSFYGALPAHEGLWESASQTAKDPIARLAIVHMVHEARGLDVHPQTVKKFMSSGDKKSVDMLENTVFPDEITHVAAGIRWFRFLAEKRGIEDPIAHFHAIVRENFRGNLKPPFNVDARHKAGFTAEWYEPLAHEQMNDGAKRVKEGEKAGQEHTLDDAH
eukprot:comp68878_c0_seq1/m.48080 comp68878_c0_seq1/g.48080  ORF comp68878_c0_seq1/g.48080 comp68878_c0_seq1/m.48080 type:complete len:305 (-) comp68878_c0_seq1:76-990(-)